jgi:hypothetical protein
MGNCVDRGLFEYDLQFEFELEGWHRIRDQVRSGWKDGWTEKVSSDQPSLSRRQCRFPSFLVEAEGSR